MGYESSIKTFGGEGFEDVFRSWGIANVVNNTGDHLHTDMRIQELLNSY